MPHCLVGVKKITKNLNLRDLSWGIVMLNTLLGSFVSKTQLTRFQIQPRKQLPWDWSYVVFVFDYIYTNVRGIKNNQAQMAHSVQCACQRITVWFVPGSGVPKFRTPSKIVPNSTRLWKLLKIAEFRTPTPQNVRKKGSKILKLHRFAIVLH